MIIDSYRCIVAVIISPYHSLANALFPDVVCPRLTKVLVLCIPED